MAARWLGLEESQNDSSDKKRNSTTVMVVEPDVLARAVLAEYLRGCGYRVLEGVNANDALALLAAKQPVEIIFSEVHLTGGLDGFSLAKHVREKHPDIDVLLTRGVAKAAEKAGDLCEDGPLEKPYHPQDVVRRINILRERRRTTTRPLG